MNDRKKDYSKILGVSRNTTQGGFDWSKFTKKSEGIRVTKKSVRIGAKLVTGIVVAVIVITAIGGVTIWMMKPQTPTPVTKPTPSPPSVWMVKPPAETPTPSPPSAPQTPAVETPRPSPPPANCEMCHEREKTAELEKHIMGLRNGKPGCFASYDRYGLGGCHGGPNAATCTYVSQESPENATCEQCHGTHLVDIHLKQGKSCTVCHRGENKEGIDPVSFIHKGRMP
ncbi:hypothetical protein DRO21_07245 [archaeon]|nr:MAG: hypothetical protein DRO21_07245 [archaeon]